MCTFTPRSSAWYFASFESPAAPTSRTMTTAAPAHAVACAIVLADTERVGMDTLLWSPAIRTSDGAEGQGTPPVVRSGSLAPSDRERARAADHACPRRLCGRPASDAGLRVRCGR